MTRGEFYAALVPCAVKAMHDTGVPASVTIAQGLLESDWGESNIYHLARNAFGIKAQDGDGWHGGKLFMPTWEVVDGREVHIHDWFRKYSTLQESVSDHAHFLQKARYEPAMAVRKDYKEFCVQLQRCGYATDPKYPQKLIQIIDDYQLSKHDTE
jgi:flagellum-specific peptidoglycan hydrolase FlgJ